MKAKIPQPVHESYLRHRKQVAWQIVLPVVLAALLIIALIMLIYFATFQGSGDVGRWAAVSTIWIILPVMLAGLVFFAILLGLIYLMMRLLNLTPMYTGMAQDYVYKAARYIQRGADVVVKPILYLDGLGASIKAFFGRK